MRVSRSRGKLLNHLAALLLLGLGAAHAEPIAVPVGTARIDISPTGPVPIINELEPNETDKIASPLFARALVIGGENPVVLVSFDGIGVTAPISEAVARSLEMSANLPRENVVVTATHTHWAPHLREHLPFIFNGPLADAQQQHADAYTGELIEKLIRVANQALADRQPCHLSWATGQVGFAANRRLRENGKVSTDDSLMHTWNPEAPVDHRLPILQARRVTDNAVHALWFSYACHNVALSGRDISRFRNQIHGDWAGLASQFLEQEHPGAVALCTIGCAGDQRPTPCGDLSVAAAHARSIAREIAEVLSESEKWTDLGGDLRAARRELQLPMEPLPENAALENWVAEIATHSRNAVARGWAAARWLQALDNDPSLQPRVPFAIHRWSFGDDLSVVFLTGEVTVDYARLLSEALPEERLWVIAYANDIPCYIVSRDLLEAGGYEASNSMYYYGWLTPLLPEAQDRIIAAALQLHPSRASGNTPDN